MNGLGYIKSPLDLRDYKPVYSAVHLPEEFQLGKVTVKNQGSVNSCVAHASSSVLEYLQHKDFSTDWIYGNREAGYYVGQGMYVRDALKTLNKKGAVITNDFLRVSPVKNIEMNEVKDVVDKNKAFLEDKASRIKITSYCRLRTIQEIKQALYSGTPVLACIMTTDMKLDEDGILLEPDNPEGGHAILLVGWNKDGFILQNSWGTTWGKNGIGVLPYDYKIEEAWSISIEENKQTAEKPHMYWLLNIIQNIIVFFRKFQRK